MTQFGQQDGSVLGDLEKTMREGAEAIDGDNVIEEALGGPPRPVTSLRVAPSEHFPEYRRVRDDSAALLQTYLRISHGLYQEREFIEFVEQMESLMEREG